MVDGGDRNRIERATGKKSRRAHHLAAQLRREGRGGELAMGWTAGKQEEPFTSRAANRPPEVEQAIS
jgi:hypothetical protein